MQLLSSYPNVDFASLSLLMDTAQYSSQKTPNFPDAFVELTVVHSPLTTTAPYVVNQVLNELHEKLSTELFANICQDLGGSEQKQASDLELKNEKQTGNNRSTYRFDSHNLFDEDAAYLDNRVPQSFRPTNCRNGLVLNYITVHDDKIVQQCASIFLTSPSTASSHSTGDPEASFVPKIAALVLCFGITGRSYSHGMSCTINSLPRRLLEFVRILSRLKKTLNSIEANEQRHNLESILALILMEDENLKTNSFVLRENGATDIKGSKDAIADGPMGKNKSTNFFGSGMSVVKIPRRINFATERRRKKSGLKNRTENKDGFNFATTALISSSLPSSDVSRIISSTQMILSLAENDMMLRPYQARMKRQEEYNIVRKSRGDQRIQKSPNRISRRLGSKFDLGVTGSDLAGFDYVSQDTKRDSSSASSSVTNSVRSESTGSTYFSSSESSSNVSIPTLLRPSRDSSVSKKEFRRNKVLAASVANKYSKSWVMNSRRPPQSQNSFQSASLTSGRKSKMGIPNRSSGRTDARFDPFTSTGECDWSDRSENNLNTNGGLQDSKKNQNATRPEKERGILLNNDTASKLVVNVAMNEDLSCFYHNSIQTSSLIEGMIHVEIKSTNYMGIPFSLTVIDTSSHIRSVFENDEYCNDISERLRHPNGNADEVHANYKYSVTLPQVDHYFPILKYKCSNNLQPVPIRMESKVRVNGVSCRVALQIRSNPSIKGDMTGLTIAMAVPSTVLGETLFSQPPGGIWNEEKRSVIWCVNELGPGQKIQMQAQFDLIEELVDDKLLKFPVLIRCQSMFNQLSSVKIDVSSRGNPDDVNMKITRRFRLSHKEK